MAECWARSLGGCSGKISGEHLISEGIFAGREIGVKGLPWCREEHRFIPIAAYTANILCTTHNSVLSPVDDAAIYAFNSLRMAQRMQDERKALLETRLWAGRFDMHDYELDGEKLERWFLKTLINMESAGKQALPLGTSRNAPGPPPELVQIAFGLRRFQNGTGLYFAGREQDVVRTAEQISYVSLIKDTDNNACVAAGEFHFFGLRFILLLEERAVPRTITGPAGTLDLIFHIKGINLDLNGQPSQRLLFSWP
ncbi:hypothetical protein [uncultured Paludibaculum sp.]|uniref:hypothetical protein n=1 Tax=uncultured Paludibaculum sp. TaxID=1765020 RepID=UPI002AABF0B7|nr:hypothetical protein [uncultured Paludibaculum sp.]